MLVEKILSIFCILFISIVIFLSFPVKINTDRPVVSYPYTDPSSITTSSVNIAETLNRPVFRQNVFKGSLNIDGIELYNNLSKTLPESIVVFGLIWFDDDFQDISSESRALARLFLHCTFFLPKLYQTE